jgi:rhamnosyltransferase subunit B
VPNWPRSCAPRSLGLGSFARGSQTCRILKRRGVLLTPASDFVPRDLPETVRHFEYAPFSSVLPKAAAIVHHGGIGTTALAFAAGVPQLVVPFVDDQFDNAVRVQRLGSGLKAPHCAFRPKTVAQMLERLLGLETIAHTCHSIAALIRQQDPLSEACRLIEGLDLNSRKTAAKRRT